MSTRLLGRVARKLRMMFDNNRTDRFVCVRKGVTFGSITHVRFYPQAHVTHFVYLRYWASAIGAFRFGNWSFVAGS